MFCFLEPSMLKKYFETFSSTRASLCGETDERLIPSELLPSTEAIETLWKLLYIVFYKMAMQQALARSEK